ncbi:hypothetical protein BU14_2469s0001 [Porphyra umbilicalis]|uniref:Uncharacterized protein n=1 Tax=Porphyra umbilicalis TaxID=2786 RepID=A0A1X6NJA5_PORUM|nr:hypothetical protein BU14_2469s0001 [Porphyra umbilicalis]|eukprot:OSX68630.1 hypothetical protein BU14_2469s0001 [Porphyra umbilicalis]
MRRAAARGGGRTCPTWASSAPSTRPMRRPPGAPPAAGTGPSVACGCLPTRRRSARRCPSTRRRWGGAWRWWWPAPRRASRGASWPTCARGRSRGWTCSPLGGAVIPRRRRRHASAAKRCRAARGRACHRGGGVGRAGPLYFVDASDVAPVAPFLAPAAYVFFAPGGCTPWPPATRQMTGRAPPDRRYVQCRPIRTVFYGGGAKGAPHGQRRLVRWRPRRRAWISVGPRARRVARGAARWAGGTAPMGWGSSPTRDERSSAPTPSRRANVASSPAVSSAASPTSSASCRAVVAFPAVLRRWRTGPWDRGRRRLRRRGRWPTSGEPTRRPCAPPSGW